MSAPGITARRIVHQTRGHVRGPVTRLMSPGDLGEFLKPFVFLDIFSLADSSKSPFGLHPHSGIKRKPALNRKPHGYLTDLRHTSF